MKKHYAILFSLMIAIVFIACNSSNESSSSKQESEEETPVKETKTEFTELQTQARSMFAVLPESAETDEYELSETKVKLGKKLYFDTRLSKEGNISCNSCHNLETFGVDNKAVSPGDDGTLGERNSPTVFNAALHIAQFWDGRAKDVEEQAGGPITNPVEMAMPNEEALEERLSGVDEYNSLFKEAFPSEENPINYRNVTLAIGAFERTLLTPSPFDDYLEGQEAALTDQQKQGLQTFMKVGCTTCHSGALLGGNLYQKFGLFYDYWEYTNSEHVDEGKYSVTNNEADKYFFKVPSLRNVEKTYPYFHDGSVEDLSEAIRIMAKTQLNKDLTDQEVADIEAFLESLTGEIPDYAAL